MTIYKYLLKSFAKLKFVFFIWVGIFLVITFSQVKNLKEQSDLEFKETKLNIAMVKNIDDKYYSALKDYFSDKASLEFIKNDEIKAREAVYSKLYDIVFLYNENEKKLEAYSNPTNPKFFIAKTKADNFINFLEITKEDEGFRIDLAKNISNSKVKTKILKTQNSKSKTQIWHYYEFKFLAYPLMALIIGIIGLANVSFKNNEVEKRTNLSAMKLYKKQLYSFLALLTGTFFIVIIVLILVMLISSYYKEVNYLSHYINIFAFALSTLGFCFLICSINTNPSFISGMSNILPLCLSFISGVFVEQNLLPVIAVKISRFFPLFYYIKACRLAVDGFSNELFIYIAIQIGFAISFFLAGLFIIKQKQKAAYFN